LFDEPAQQGEKSTMEAPAFFKEALESAIPEAYPNKETDENAE